MADNKKVKTAAVLPLSVEDEKEKNKKQARASLLSQLPGVRDVILWTLLHAGVFPLSVAMGMAYYKLITTIFSHPASSRLLPGHMEMTDAEETVADALMNGMLWCAAPQAAAAVVALMLRRRQHRRLRLIFAYAALVATFASHCMLAGAIRLFSAADPAGGVGLFFRTVGTAIISIVGVADLLCFLGLVLRGGEE